MPVDNKFVLPVNKTSFIYIIIFCLALNICGLFLGRILFICYTFAAFAGRAIASPTATVKAQKYILAPNKFYFLFCQHRYIYLHNYN